MSNFNQAVYRFEVTDPVIVDDLRDLWQESVVDWNRHSMFVCVKSDPISINQFLSFYDLCLFLEAPDNDLPSILVCGPNFPGNQSHS